MRTVTVFATKGKRTAKIETDVTTWGELKSLVSNEGYDLGSLNATESITRTDLAHQDAVLPTGDFTLFLRPAKTKSGVDYSSMGFKELRAELTQTDKEALASETGKNWTRCSKEDIATYLSNKSAGASTTTSTTDDASEEASENASENAIENADNNTARIALVEKLLAEIKDTCETDEVSDRVDLVSDEIEGLVEAIQAEESPEAAAEKARQEAEAKAAEEEKQRLANEASDLMSGF